MSVNLRLTSQHYSCRRCGLCCRRFHIAVTKKEAERMEIPADKNGDDIFIPCRPGTVRCIFLDDDQLCEVHRSKG